MGKRGRKLAVSLLMTSLCVNTAWAQQQIQTDAQQPDTAETVCADRRIEQVNVNMPELVMYAAGVTADEVRGAECYLAQEKLTLVGEPEVFADSREGIYYYVLLDISGSIPDSYFSAMKDGVMKLQEHLMPEDKLVLYTFGDEVLLAADGSQNAEELSRVLSGLDNHDQETLLFEAIHQVASVSEQMKENQITRQVLVVMTDGEDFALGKKQSQEAQTNLRDKGLPTYAFGIRDTKKEYINSFGEFARTSGGDIVVFTPDEGADMLLGLQASLQDDIRAEYRAASNLVTYQTESFSLKFSDNTVLKKEVMSDHWIPDEENPYLVQGTCIGAQQIRLEFSEPLKGLDGSANYQLTFEGKPVAVTGISYDKGNSSVVNLSLAEPVKNGTYELNLAHITDISMEENPVVGSSSVEGTEQTAGLVSISVDDAPVVEEPYKNTRSFDYTGVLFLIFAAVVALLIVVIVMSRKKKEPEEKEPESSAAGHGPKQVLLNRQDFSQHVVMPETQMKNLQVLISKNGMRPQSAVWKLGSSLIVGRSSICDICIEDGEMSRQHFCLERDGEQIYIMDLQSTNGTAVNGIRIGSKRRLDSGSTIEAGSIRITIRW
ncbi:MAG: FHA domain-containing protein [Brotaphodocola sp.]